MSTQTDETETGSIEISRVINAPAERIYNAFLDADALGKFSPPAGYTATYDHVEPEIGGTYHGTFTALETKESHSFGGEYVELVPHKRIVQSDQFETDVPEMQSVMTVTITLEEVEDSTTVTVRQEGIPKPIPEEDAATGWGMSLENLTRLVEFPEAG
jgi:uncharacterized protein YndB with AHSA1/START domain